MSRIRTEIEFEIEVAAVTNDRAIFHPREVLAVDDVPVSSDGHEDAVNGCFTIGIT